MNPLQDLRDVDAPATTVTVERLLRAGRSRVRRRRAAITGAAAAVVLVLTLGAAALAVDRHPAPGPIQPGRTPSAAPSAGCRSVELPGDGAASAPVIDSTGRWAAALYTGTHTVAIWHDGALVTVRDDVAVDSVVGISAKGEIAVNAGRRAMVMNAEISWLLTIPPGVVGEPVTEARGMNASGDVVGTLGTVGGATGAGGGAHGAVLWRYRDPGRPVVLATPSGGRSVALAIGSDGTVGGSVDGRPYLWRPSGTAIPLRPAAGGVDAIAGDWAVDFGRRLGWRIGGPGDPVAQGVDVGSGQPHALAADGTIAGGAWDGAYLIRDGLETALPMPGERERFEVGGISADGRTIGGAVDGHPLRWICGE